MAQRLINFWNGKIESEVLSDIVMTSRKCHDGFKNVYIYGYEDKWQNLTDVKNTLQQLQSFWYIQDFQEVWEGYYKDIDFRTDIENYSSKKSGIRKNAIQFRYREARFFVRVLIPKWNYLNYLIDRWFKNIPWNFIENERDHKTLYDYMKIIKKDISVFKDLIYVVTKEQKQFIEWLSKIKTTQRYIYAEHTLYFLYFCDNKIIELLKEEILSHKEKLEESSKYSEKIQNIRVDSKWLIWSGQKKVGDLTPKQLELYELFNRWNMRMVWGNAIKSMKMNTDSFKKLKDWLSKRMKNLWIEKLFRFEFDRKSKTYSFIINERESIGE